MNVPLSGRRILSIAAAAVALCVTGGCASILHGPTQRIEIVTAPEGAVATAEGQTVTTPGVMRLSRKAKGAEIRIEKEGYLPRIVHLVRVTSSAVWWNLLEIPVGMVAGGAVGANATNDGGWFSGLSGAAYGGAAGGVGLTGIGFAVDYANGSAYRLEPARVVVRLEPADGTPVAQQAVPEAVHK
jgi:hypothetical protein